MKLKISSALGRKDEQPNIALAEHIVKEKDIAAIRQLISGLDSDKAAANDCIKVLYEVGSRFPLLISPYSQEFIKFLKSRNNRLVWGAMTALSTIAEIKAEQIFSRLDEITEAYKTGSVITVDSAISVFAGLAKAGPGYEKTIFPIIINHLKTCRPKEIPQHSERYLPALTAGKKDEFIKVLNSRMQDLSDSGKRRIDKVIKEAERRK